MIRKIVWGVRVLLTVFMAGLQITMVMSSLVIAYIALLISPYITAKEATDSIKDDFLNLFQNIKESWL